MTFTNRALKYARTMLKSSSSAPGSVSGASGSAHSFLNVSLMKNDIAHTGITIDQKNSHRARVT